MRLIQLIHPEYQITNNNIEKKVLANAKIYNKVAEEQHGSNQHHQAGLLLLNEVLVGNLFCLTCFSDCYAINDARGCYIKIDHAFAILVPMFFRMPWCVATNLFRVFQQACHSIETATVSLS